jgi:cytochrome c-type biogenesis protein CcsB
MGRALEVFPVQDAKDESWKSVGHLISGTFTAQSDPSGELRGLQQMFVQLRESFLQQNAQAFNNRSRELLSGIQHFSQRSPDYPSEQIVALEVTYNRWQPFRISWIAMFVSVIAMLLYWCLRWKRSYTFGVIAYIIGLVAVVAGFALRIVIAGRPPVTNMYESVVYVGAGIVIFGLLFELIYRKKYILSAAAAAATFALVLADNSPVVLDPSMRPLEPVLRNNFWLVTHVMTITLSYAALGLAMAIANITLGYYYLRSQNWETINLLSSFTYRAIQLGVLLLSAGVILGGVWADYSWGRFWGWDPKEVWALIALLGYLAVLHARFVGWVGSRGLAALSVACFALVVMAWYGVNFVLGAGLHSYGFGGGGQIYVYLAVVLQLIYVAMSLLRSIDIEDEPSAWPSRST